MIITSGDDGKGAQTSDSGAGDGASANVLAGDGNTGQILQEIQGQTGGNDVSSESQSSSSDEIQTGDVVVVTSGVSDLPATATQTLVLADFSGVGLQDQVQSAGAQETSIPMYYVISDDAQDDELADDDVNDVGSGGNGTVEDVDGGGSSSTTNSVEFLGDAVRRPAVIGGGVLYAFVMFIFFLVV